MKMKNIEFAEAFAFFKRSIRIERILTPISTGKIIFWKSRDEFILYFEIYVFCFRILSIQR